MAEQKHRNDIYGDLDKPSEAKPAIPAATVVLLRDGADGVEVLMLHKNSKIAFGGMWVSPGGKIDPEDYPEDGNLDAAAHTAAQRETAEEAGLELDPSAFVQFAHWTPPPSTPVRFATYFFAAAAPTTGDVAIDDGEIKNFAWMRPADALARHDKGEIDLAPPTWITLHHISLYSPSATVIEHFKSQDVKVYETHVGKAAAGHRVAMWAGDAGYDATDADAPGDRHRLVMAEGGFTFENNVETY